MLQLQAEGVIVPFDSAWESPVRLLGIVNGSKTLFGDYRFRQEVTRTGLYCLSRTADRLHELLQAHCFDGAGCEVWLSANCAQMVGLPHKTGFIGRDNSFKFMAMSFGRTPAPATFQRLMKSALNERLVSISR